MKLSIMFLSFFISLAVVAQNGSTVNITMRGNSNREVRVDGKNYSVNNEVSTAISENTPIRITNLALGQHSLEVVRTSRNNNTTRPGNATIFSLRSGYDLNIAINTDGSVQISETRIKRNTGYQNRYKRPMSDENFDVLVQNIQYMRGNNAKVVAINNAFNNTSNYFTTAQASKLIRLVYSQSSRLSLAKSSYRAITDPANFSQMNELLTSQASRTELATYTRNYEHNNPGNNSNQDYTKVAMTDASFNNLYNNISNQFGPGAKMSTLTNEFNNTNNYFTTAQTKQLIQLVSDENNRLQLAKLAYNNVVDPENYSQLYNLLSSQSSRNELDVYVRANGSNNTGSSVRTPMTDASFTNLYNNISNQWGIGAKMSALTVEFNNTNNNFTTVQARQLIQLVSDENNRFELAKSSYDNIVDQENFSRLYDLLTSQIKRNELAEYVRSYSYNR